MKHIDAMLELADKEFEAIEKNGKFRSREEIDSVYKLMDIVKDGMCIQQMEDGEMYDDASYGDGMSYRGGRSYRGSYDGSYEGESYARGRGRNARRDSMGRYSRDDGYDYRGGRNMNYSRGDAKHEYIENLRSMMEDAPSEEVRQNIQRMISQMEQG